MSHKSRILIVLQDGKWHSFRELLEVYYKYTQRLFDLRRDGYVIEERNNISNKNAFDYRLVKEPLEIIKPKAVSLETKSELCKAIVIPSPKHQEKQMELFG